MNCTRLSKKTLMCAPFYLNKLYFRFVVLKNFPYKLYAMIKEKDKIYFRD